MILGAQDAGKSGVLNKRIDFTIGKSTNFEFSRVDHVKCTNNVIRFSIRPVEKDEKEIICINDGEHIAADFANP
jgi:hypothetical protein